MVEGGLAVQMRGDGDEEGGGEDGEHMVPDVPHDEVHDHVKHAELVHHGEIQHRKGRHNTQGGGVLDAACDIGTDVLEGKIAGINAAGNGNEQNGNHKGHNHGVSAPGKQIDE